MSQSVVIFFATIGIFAVIFILLMIVAAILPDSSSANNAPSLTKEEEDFQKLEQLATELDTCFRLKEWKQAEITSRATINLARQLSLPDFVQSANGCCGLALLFLGEFDSAISFLTHSHKNPSDLYYRAIANYSADHYYSAIEDCLKVLQEQNDCTSVLWLSGISRLKVGDRTLAISDFKKAAALEKQNGSDLDEDHHGYYFRALAYNFAKKKNKAMDDAHRALEISIAYKDSFYSEASRVLIKEITSESDIKD